MKKEILDQLKTDEIVSLILDEVDFSDFSDDSAVLETILHVLCDGEALASLAIHDQTAVECAYDLVKMILERLLISNFYNF